MVLLKTLAARGDRHGLGNREGRPITGRNWLPLANDEGEFGFIIAGRNRAKQNRPPEKRQEQPDAKPAIHRDGDNGRNRMVPAFAYSQGNGNATKGIALPRNDSCHWDAGSTASGDAGERHLRQRRTLAKE